MPISGYPPVYTRGYDYEAHSQTQPSVPQPGDKLNQDFDDIADAIAGYSHAVDAIVDDNGNLLPGIITEAQFAPGLFDDVEDDIEADLQPMVDQAHGYATAAQHYATDTATNASLAAQAAAAAKSAQTTTQDTATTANAARDDAINCAAQSCACAAQSANSASTSSNAMQQSLANRDLSFKWAEYLAGPVEPAPPGWPEAIDDGLWSSKWWALYARDMVGDWGGMYLGAYPDAPDKTHSGQPLQPGMLYFNTVDNILYVWNGTAWVNPTQLAPGSQSRFVYTATVAGPIFAGPDDNGHTPAYNQTRPEQTDIHLNGVRLVEGKDFTVNLATPSLTIAVPVPVGAVVQWDLLVPPITQQPGGATIYKLVNIDRDPTSGTPGQIDGVRTTFPLYYVDPVTTANTPVPAGDTMQIVVQLDGVAQEPGPDYSRGDGTITFTEAPQLTARFWGTYLKAVPA